MNAEENSIESSANDATEWDLLPAKTEEGTARELNATAIPTFATHYHLDGRAPFRSLSDLSDEQLQLVLEDLRATRNPAGSKRVFGRRYMQMRRLTEDRLRDCFRDRIGEPERRHPHYFVLGASAWFQGLADATRSITIPLSAFPPRQTSITYPDSFESMGYGPEFGLPYEPKPYHGMVFRLDELLGLHQQWGLPRDDQDSDYEGYQNRSMDFHVEIQLWSDEPLRPWLGQQ